MKKLISIIVLILCCFVFFNIGKKVVDEIEYNAVVNALNDDKYTAEEYAEFQKQLNSKTFYYYNNLTDDQKDAYITLYFAVMNFDESCKVNVSEDELKNILFAIIYDNSEIFWLSSNYTYYDNADFIEFVPEYNYTEIEANRISKQLENKITEITSAMPADATDFEKELFLHNYICDNTVYDESTFQNGGDTAYSSLLEGKSICEGYARAMQMLLDNVGIDNYLIIGDGTSGGTIEPHMWNVVEIDGYNYHLDVTWNDGVFDDTDSFFYFNVTDAYIMRDHSNLEPENNNCSYNYANYFAMMNTYVEVFTGFDNLVSATSSVLSSGENTVEFMFDSSADYKRAIDELEDNSRFFDYVKKSVIKSGRNLSHNNVDYYKSDEYNYLCIVFKED